MNVNYVFGPATRARSGCRPWPWLRRRWPACRSSSSCPPTSCCAACRLSRCARPAWLRAVRHGSCFEREAGRSSPGRLTMAPWAGPHEKRTLPCPVHWDRSSPIVMRLRTPSSAGRGWGSLQPEDVVGATSATSAPNARGNWKAAQPADLEAALGGGLRTHKEESCSCGQDLPAPGRYVFRSSGSGQQASYLLGQQPARRHTIFWETPYAGPEEGLTQRAAAAGGSTEGIERRLCPGCSLLGFLLLAFLAPLRFNLSLDAGACSCAGEAARTSSSLVCWKSSSQGAPPPGTARGV